jgi:hypothetical protein
MPGGLTKIEMKSRTHHRKVIMRKRTSKYLRARTRKRLYGETWEVSQGYQGTRSVVAHCWIVRAEVIAIRPLWRKQSSPFISFRPPDVGVVMRRSSMRLVFFTIFTLLTVLARSPERDHGDGTGWTFGKEEDEGEVVIAE